MTAALHVAEYHARVYRRIWRGSVATVVIGPVLYLLAMGIGVGSLIDDNVSSGLGDTPYLEFVAPGLMAAAAMQTAMAQSLYPVLSSVKWVRTAYGLAATPLRPVDIAVGLQSWLALQILVAATVFLGVIALAGAVGSPLALLAPLAATLGGLAYSTSATASSTAGSCDTGKKVPDSRNDGRMPRRMIGWNECSDSRLMAQAAADVE